MKTLFISLSFIAVTVAAAIMIRQAKPLSSDQTSEVIIYNQPIPEKQIHTIDDQAAHRNEVSYQSIDERLQKLEAKPQLEPLPKDLTEAEREALVIEEKQREQEEDQRYIERLSAYYAELENQLSLQAVDMEWAGTKEEQIVRSFETLSSVDNVDLTGIDCRTNSCIIDFEILPSENESPTLQSTLFDWLLENTGNCEIHGEAAVAPANPEGQATQRIHLVNCV